MELKKAFLNLIVGNDIVDLVSKVRLQEEYSVMVDADVMQIPRERLVDSDLPCRESSAITMIWCSFDFPGVAIAGE